MSIPLKSIAENPFRVLGVFANSPLKERTANASKLKAFLRVGKSVAFPSDFASILPAPVRTPESVSAAENALALPAERLRHAQFWFLFARPTDNAAFAHLSAGNVLGATEIWSKIAGVSAIQNRMLCAFARGNLRAALADADLLYGNDFRLTQWIETVAPGDVAGTDLRRLKSDFADTLCRDAGTENVLAALPQNSALRTRICEQASAPIIDEIYALVSAAKNERKNGSAAALAAGRRLVAQAGMLIAQLRRIAGENSAEYRATADKLGNEVLQCAIDYFNKSDEPDAARKAMELMKFARATVAGTMARERCAENLRVMEKNLEALPPPEVSAEASAINASLRKFDARAETLENARALIAETRPRLLAICAKLGSAHKFYLKISTQVVALALNCIIESVNRAQEKLKSDSSFSAAFFQIRLTELAAVLRNAWEIIEMLDAFHMEAEFERERYTPNRDVLRRICRNLRVGTSSRRVPAPKPAGTQTSGTQTASGKSEKNFDVSTAFVVFFAVAAVILVLFVASASCGSKRSSSRSSYGNSYYSDSSYRNSSYGNSSYRNSYSDSGSTRSRENSYSSSGASSSAYSSSQKKSEPETAKSAESAGTISAESAGTASASKFAGTASAKSAPKSAAKSAPVRPSSGSKPYFLYYVGIGGRNYLSIKTHGEDDFAVIVQNHSSGEVVNHVYIRGGDEKQLNLPDGVYDIFVYSGRDWDWEKNVGNVSGGFSKNGHFQKDENLELRGECCEYELFSDDASPDTATADEAFPPPNCSAGTQTTTSSSTSSAGTTSAKSSGTQSAYSSSSGTYSSYSAAGTYSSRPRTGDTPYFSHYGIDTERGPNTLTFNTSGSDDYVVIVKKRYSRTVVGHIYIRGGDIGRLKVPNGNYDVFFYSGRDWDAEKIVGSVRGGFSTGASVQKDAALSLNYTDCTYTLYPVLNGNLSLEHASEYEAF